MIFRTRKLIKSEDLNSRGTLFGGQCMKWLDEEAAIYVICQLGTSSIVTKLISEINFISPAHLGDVIEIGMTTIATGRTSITIQCEIRNKMTEQTIVKIDKMVFVCVDESGKPTPHGKTEVK
jgi:acyl-CoA hydrolase